jgi:signal transduction histidine kinase
MLFNDENRIKQVLVNLIGNAFKFTLLGEISVVVKRNDFQGIRVAVSDTGIGIKEEDKGKLIVAFGKSESDENKQLNRQGVGLGLLISNLIVRTLNHENQGLQFSSTY